MFKSTMLPRIEVEIKESKVKLYAIVKRMQHWCFNHHVAFLSYVIANFMGMTDQNRRLTEMCTQKSQLGEVWGQQKYTLAILCIFSTSFYSVPSTCKHCSKARTK